MAQTLNKGSRPGFVEPFQVTLVGFGHSPPIISNVQWTPIFEKTNQNQSSTDSKENPKLSSDTILADPNNDNSGSGKSGIDQSTSPVLEQPHEVPPKNKTETKPQPLNRDVGISLHDLGDPEFDVACTADLSFKSGVQFSLSTRYDDAYSI